MDKSVLLAIIIIALICMVLYLKLNIDFILVILTFGIVSTELIDKDNNMSVEPKRITINTSKSINTIGGKESVDKISGKEHSNKLTYTIFAQEPSLDIDILKHKLVNWQEKKGPVVHFAYGNGMRGLKDKFYKQLCELKNFLNGKKYFADKGELWKNVTGDFMPKTSTSFANLKLPCIVKPIGGFAQQGIKIVNTMEEIKDIDTSNVIISEMVSNPMMWTELNDDKEECLYKFHIRVYLALYVVDGITKVYLNKYARVLTAGAPYTEYSKKQDKKQDKKLDKKQDKKLDKKQDKKLDNDEDKKQDKKQDKKLDNEI